MPQWLIDLAGLAVDLFKRAGKPRSREEIYREHDDQVERDRDKRDRELSNWRSKFGRDIDR